MIVVMCDSWKNAQEAYEDYISFIDSYCVDWAIVERYDLCCCVHTDDGFRVIFIDRRIAGSFGESGNDFIGEEDFFEELHHYYSCWGDYSIFHMEPGE